MADRVDTHEVHELAQLLATAPAAAPKDSRKVLQKGLLNIKTDAQLRTAGLAHAPAYPRAITYESHETPGGGWGEVGPDKDRRQGALGNILEFGTVKNAPIPHMRPAADTEEPKFVRAMEALGVKATGLQ